MTFIEEFMPLLNGLNLLLTFHQMKFYLRLNDDRAKFITLFRKALIDSGNFLSIFLLLCVVTGIFLHVMGARFDDGGNFLEDYDTNFNDYAQVFEVGVSIIGVLRNSVGDL